MNRTITIDNITYTLVDSAYPSPAATDVGKNVWRVNARNETGSGVLAFDATDFTADVDPEDYDWDNYGKYTVHSWIED